MLLATPVSTFPAFEGAAGVLETAGGGDGVVLAGGARVGVDPALLVPLLVELPVALAPFPAEGAPFQTPSVRTCFKLTKAWPPFDVYVIGMQAEIQKNFIP